MFQLGIDGPVFPRDESGDFVLALADHAQSRLCTFCGQTRAHFFHSSGED